MGVAGNWRIWVGLRPVTVEEEGEMSEQTTQAAEQTETTTIEGELLSTSPKPGVRTSEFWLTLLATLIAAALGSGLLPEGSLAGKFLAIGGAVLLALGYSAVRAVVKTRSGGPLTLLTLVLIAAPGCATVGGQHKFDVATALETACAVSPALNTIATQGVCANLPEPKKTTCLRVSAIVNVSASALLTWASNIYQVCRDPSAKVPGVDTP